MAGAVQNGATNALEVYQSLGCQPVCGKCVPYVEEELLAGRTAAVELSSK